MSLDLSQCLVVGISSRSLFDLEQENSIFEQQGVAAYAAYQRAHEHEPLKPGSAFPLAKALLRLNELSDQRLVEVVVMSRNSPDTGLRAFNAIETHGLDISRAAFTGGEGHALYLQAFDVDLFLSKSEDDVCRAVQSGVAAAAMLYDPPRYDHSDEEQIRIAFDADSVLFSNESELIYQQEGLAAFTEHESSHRQEPMTAGPFARLLKTLSLIQSRFASDNPLRIAIVTARSSPAHERVIRTLRAWNVHVDEAFFLGGVSKTKVLEAFRPHIFFDDQDVHLQRACKAVPVAKVPSKDISS